MRVDIFADLVCPWCFIGKRRFERAAAMRPDVSLVIRWRPFQLNPDMPAGGMAADAFFAAKFGSPALVRERQGAVAEIGKSLGIDFAFERIAREPNTLDAHRLVRFAGKRGRADAVAEALFAGHFLAGRDIGDRAVLAAIGAEAAGLDRREVGDFLDSGAETDVVVAEEQEARRLGVTAVPCYLFDRQYAVAGAQEPEFFLPIFDLAQPRAAALR